MQTALLASLAKVKLNIGDIDGLIAVPSLAESHFMEAHFLGKDYKMLNLSHKHRAAAWQVCHCEDRRYRRGGASHRKESLT
jgi:hypothetical protein